jgi:hypothetical protein
MSRESNRMKKPIYVGVFLDEQSKQALLNVLPPKHPNVFVDHLTLAFGKAMSDSYELGKVIELEILAACDDEKGQAVTCSTSGISELLAPGQNPHITVSCAEGVAPKYSSELLQKSATPLKNKLVVRGILDYFPRTR